MRKLYQIVDEKYKMKPGTERHLRHANVIDSSFKSNMASWAHNDVLYLTSYWCPPNDRDQEYEVIVSYNYYEDDEE